jgi:kynureninase
MTKQPQRYMTRSGELLSPRWSKFIDAWRKLPKARQDELARMIEAEEAEVVAKEGGAS